MVAPVSTMDHSINTLIKMNDSFDFESAKAAYEKLLSTLPLHEESVKDTPLRAAKALRELTNGYHQTLEGVVGRGLFPYKGNGVVHVSDLDIYSTCEHHLLPFIGTCDITYIPNGKILGLSKLKRISEMFARRLQVQERLTDQIADAIQKVTEAKGVLVVIRSIHLCMKLRGVKETRPETMTVSTRGEFTVNKDLQGQYLSNWKTNPKL